jgi:hypothetical protein
MAWIKGTSTNYQTLMDALFQAMTRLSVQTMAVNAGGTGYVVGDVVTISGGTSTIPAQARVLTAPAGVVGTVAIENSGVYTVAPATSGAATTGGTGTGLTLNTTNASNGWVAQRTLQLAGCAQSAVIAAGGTGYTVGDTLTVSGGTAYAAATFRVLTAPGGVVATVGLLNGGDYVATPGNPAATTGGTGTGCTLTVTYGTAGSGTEREFIAKGTGLGGTDNIYCGVRSYFDSGTGARSWELCGFTGFSVDANGNPNTNLWANMPGISVGRFDGGTDTGSYVNLSNTANTYWFSINGRRVIGVAKIGSAYISFTFGFLNPYATTGENPYPLYICGSSNVRFVLSSSSSIALFGIANPQNQNNTVGAGQMRFTDGAWYSVNNASGTSTRTPKNTGFVLFPAGGVSNITATGADLFFSATQPFDISNLVPQSGTPGTQSNTLNRTDGSTPVVPLIPCTILTNSPSLAVVGEIDGLFWLDVRGGIVSEDTITQNNQRYRVFQSANQTDGWAHFAVKEQ